MKDLNPTFLAVVFVCSVAGYVLYMQWANNYIDEQEALIDSEYAAYESDPFGL